MINRAPYKDPDNPDRWTIDVDANDEVNYVWNVTQWLVDNATSVKSFTLAPVGCTVLLQGAPQWALGALLPARLKVTFPIGVDAHCTAQVLTMDDQKFDKTIWFKQVEN